MLPWNAREFHSYPTGQKRSGAETRPVLNSPYRDGLPRFSHQTPVLASTRQYFDTLLRLIPEGKRPAVATMDLLRKQADAGLIFIRIGESVPVGGLGSRGTAAWNVVIMAPSEDLAKKLARAMLTLLDEGLSRRVQTNALKARAKTVGDLKVAKQDLEKNERLEDAISKSLETMTSIDKSALADFRQRRNLLEVDLAGVRARIEAADKLLRTGNPKPSTRDQIMNLKIAAEIELAGLVAQQKAVTHLIELGEQRLAREAELGRQRMQVARKRNAVREFKHSVETYDNLIKTFLRPLELVDDRVTICPVKWGSK